MARAGTRPDRGLHHRCRDPSWPSHPVVIYRLSHGPNEEVLQRDPATSEAFSTNITQTCDADLLGHRMRRPRRPAGPILPTPEQAVGKEWTPLGLAATIGFAWLMLVALVALVRATRGPPTEAASNFDDARQRHLSMLALTAMALRDHRRDLVHHRLDHFPGSPQVGGGSTPFIAVLSLARPRPPPRPCWRGAPSTVARPLTCTGGCPRRLRRLVLPRSDKRQAGSRLRPLQDASGGSISASSTRSSGNSHAHARPLGPVPLRVHFPRATRATWRPSWAISTHTTCAGPTPRCLGDPPTGRLDISTRPLS